MGRKSKKLENKGEAVKALFGYVKTQSGKMNIELERQFIESYYQSERKNNVWNLPLANSGQDGQMDLLNLKSAI